MGYFQFEQLVDRSDICGQLRGKEFMDEYFDGMKAATNIEEFEVLCQGPDLMKGV